MKTTDEYLRKISDLDEENERLKTAIEWFGRQPAADSIVGRVAQYNAMRQIAFPPQFEEITEKRMVCRACNRSYTIDEHRDYCCKEELTEFIGKVKRLIPRKYKRREDVYFHTTLQHYCLINDDGRIIKLKDVAGDHGCKIVAEWEE